MDTYELKTIRSKKDEFINYSHIVFDNKNRDALIVDPAWDLNGIIDVIEKNNLNLKWILLTHSHKDHVNLVDALNEKYNTEVFISEIESNFYGYKCDNLRLLKDNEKLILGSIECKCILTPGHTAGGMCFIIGKYIFTGDTLFTEGCGVCDSIGGSSEEMFYSLQRLKAIIPQNTEVYPGHSFGISMGKTMEDLYSINIYLNLDEKDEFIKFRDRKNTKPFVFK